MCVCVAIRTMATTKMMPMPSDDADAEGEKYNSVHRFIHAPGRRVFVCVCMCAMHTSTLMLSYEV